MEAWTLRHRIRSVGVLAALLAVLALAPTAAGDTVPTDPYWPGSAWAYVRTGTTAAWDVTTGSAATRVAVVDSGVAAVPDLAGSPAGATDLARGDTVADDELGLGTEVAGVVAARGGDGVGTAGVCWGCKVLAVKVAAPRLPATAARVAAGIDWAVANGADVVVTSYATPLSTPVLQASVAAAVAADVVVVAAAGSEGLPSPRFPAAYPGVVSVAATDRADARAGFSNYGSWVRLAAPGCLHTSDRFGGTRVGCATAFAAGFVAGVAGLARSYAPAASAAQVRGALEASADPLARGVVAAGRVDAVGTLVALGATAPPPGPPVATTAPRVAGDLRLDGLLTGFRGDWLPRAGGGAVAYAFAWQRCDATAALCTAVASATAGTYRITAADAGFRIRLAVTATQSGASAVAYSAATAAVALPAAPAVVVAPSVGGTARVGSFLTGFAGRWSDAAAVRYQWTLCDAAGVSCTPVPGATASFYSPAPGDVGLRVGLTVSATGPGGSTSVAATPSAAVASYPAPLDQVPPEIEGTPAPGRQLVAVSGVWRDALTLAVRWRRCTAGTCADVPGATGWTYDVGAADLGSTLVVRITAGNGAGATDADSAPTATVAASGAPGSTGLPAVRASGPEFWVSYFGAWSGSPASVAVSWLRCDPAGAACAPIAGASGAVYRVAPADVGATLRARVTATGAGGSASADSAPTALVTST